MQKNSPRLILTLGDPNGIGPEIILKIFNTPQLKKKYSLKISGSKRILDKYSSLLNLPFINRDDIIEIPFSKGFKLSPGKTDKKAGEISGTSITTAVDLCKRKIFDAMVTLPVSKESLNLGGFNYPGHTEMLSDLTSSEDVVMILYSKKFSTALLTGHIALKNVSKQISEELIFRKIITVNNSLVTNFKIKNPKIAVLSLNPHSGDGGIIGNEEQSVIIPAITKMNNSGFNIRGPYSPDAYFAAKKYCKFDITVSMYHDQALIPFKMISFDKGVNYTAGLSIVRTSPDHGTAFDISGTGHANPQSTIEAIKLAYKLAGLNKKIGIEQKK